MNNKYLLVLIVLVISFTGCKKKITLFSSDRDLEEFTTDDFEFEYLQTKSKVRFQSPDQSISSSANIRIKKDSLIWISLAPALGIELARGVISADTIIFIDRINKEVHAYNYAQISRMLNFPVDFQIMQSMILGNLPIERKAQDKLTKTNSQFILSQVLANLSIENSINLNSRKLEQIKMLEQPSGNSMLIEYGDFRAIESEVFPFLGNISIIYKSNQGDEETNVRIEHSRVESMQQPLSFPFSIPDKYKM